jgi:hypothetical protein
MTEVLTTEGLIPLDQLRVVDTPEIQGNARTIKTEYFLGDTVVRRDGWAVILSGFELGMET